MSATRTNITIGTAGHIDHGKTALVGLLTGCDTDRLKEEKERGMSIELGYAPCTVSELEIGIVDVPGHERFVKTMVAGATGIDGVILVVAADDGIMPQTREHLDILTLLGIEHGIVALTKIDRVDADHLAVVRDDLDGYLSKTFLAGAPVCPMSNITGEGYDAFYSALAQLVASITPKTAGGVFRLPVERAFTSKGFGTVVTGIPCAGAVKTGDEVVLLPQNVKGRISAIEVYGKPSEEALAGQCAALNVRQWEHDRIEHGNTITLDGYFEPVSWVVCSLRLLPHDKLFAQNGTHVKFHTGTSETAATLYLLEGDHLRGGESGLAQFRLDEPVIAGPGDHYIVRLLSPVVTIGGGVVIDAVARRLKRTHTGLVNELREHAAAITNENDFVEFAVRHPVELPASAADVARRTKLPKHRVQALLDELTTTGHIVAIAPRHYVHADTLAESERPITEILERFHAQSPTSVGLTAEELGERAGLPGNVLAAVVERMVDKERISESNGWYMLAGHTSTLPPEDQVLSDRIERIFLERLFTPPSHAEVEIAVGISQAEAKRGFRLLIDRNRLIFVGGGMYFHCDAIEEAKRRLLAHFAKEDRFESVQFKYLLETTRKYALPILDYFDKIGLTRRAGNTRFLKKPQ
ncbi:MAG: selenocysteine-specific translation elongation factor [Verrucomicrobia bacterium]|nr:selenocysteine-specific translation elongation factor [Verrucomicrobiota bacterium]